MRHMRWLGAAPLVGLLLAVLLVGCSVASTGADAVDVDWETLPRNGAGFRKINVDQLVTLLEQQDLPLINTHIPYEGELPGTDAFVPFDEIPAYADLLPADKEAPFVIYCRSGSMSASAGGELADLGYTNVLDLEGGMRAWERSGRELFFR